MVLTHAPGIVIRRRGGGPFDALGIAWNAGGMTRTPPPMFTPALALVAALAAPHTARADEALQLTVAGPDGRALGLVTWQPGLLRVDRPSQATSVLYLLEAERVVTIAHDARRVVDASLAELGALEQRALADPSMDTLAERLPPEQRRAFRDELRRARAGATKPLTLTRTSSRARAADRPCVVYTAAAVERGTVCAYEPSPGSPEAALLAALQRFRAALERRKASPTLSLLGLGLAFTSARGLPLRVRGHGPLGGATDEHVTTIARVPVDAARATPPEGYAVVKGR